MQIIKNVGKQANSYPKRSEMKKRETKK